MGTRGSRNLGGKRVRCDDGLVRTMVDAETPLKATIQPEDIKDAVCGDPANCAIARAIMRVEANHGRSSSLCSVGADKAYLTRGDLVLRYAVPRNEAALIRTFDAAGVFPTGFTVTLTPVRQSDRLGARRSSRGYKDRSKPVTRKDDPPKRLPTRRVGGPRFVPNKKAPD